MRVIAQAALEGSPSTVVLDPVAPERQDGPVVGMDRHLDVDLAVGLGHQNSHVLLDAEQRCGLVDVGVDRFRESGSHSSEASDRRTADTATPPDGTSGARCQAGPSLRATRDACKRALLVLAARPPPLRRRLSTGPGRSGVLRHMTESSWFVPTWC